MKKYYGYIRVSTVKQGEHGVSLQEQRDAIINFSMRNDLTIIQWFEEKETAAKRGRPIFNQMLKLLRRGKADGLIVHKIDRSARNLKDWADLGELIDQNIEVHFANENLDLSSRGGRLTADIQAVVSADYVRNLREETRKGFYGRIKQGLYPLPAPIGYLDTGKGKPKEPDLAKAPLVKKAFELYGSGKYSLKKLVEKMYSLGLKNRNDKKVSLNGLSFILNNPFYIGLIKLKFSGELFPGVHKPVIKKSLFDRVQMILKGKHNGKIQKYDFLFRRLFTCKHCGYSIIGETHKGHKYYRCHTKECPTTCIREEEINNEIYDKLSGITLNKKEGSYLKSKVTMLVQEWEKEKRVQIEPLKLNLKKIEDRIERLTDALIEQIIEKDVFEKRNAKLLMEKKSVEENLSELKSKKKTVSDKLSKFLELVKNPYISYKLALPEKKRKLLEIITSNLSVDGKNVELKLKIPFQEVVNCQKIANGSPYRDRPRKKLNRLFDKLVEYFSSEDI